MSAPLEQLLPYGSLTDAEYTLIKDLVYQHSRIDLGPAKKSLLMARLPKRIKVHSLSSYTDYCKLLQSTKGPQEILHLIDVVSTNHTYFFREPAHFDFLEKEIIPEFVKNQKDLNRPLRIWSAASSTGEEPYSLGITLEKKLAPFKRAWKLDCTDISITALEKARAGIFQEKILLAVPEEIKRQFFSKSKETSNFGVSYQANQVLRTNMRFHQLNLLKPPYPFQGKFDTIFCRNVMIYFDRKTKEELLGYLLSHLEPNGYLIVGQSESLAGIPHKLKTVYPSIFQKK